MIGKKIQLTTAAGGQFINFTTATTATDEISSEGTGNYTYSANTSSRVGTFHITFPSTGDFYDLTLTFSSGSTTQGTVSGNQHYDNRDHAISGTFRLSSL